MNRKFRKIRFPYNPLHYRDIRGFRPDAQPHSAKCDCKACMQAYALLSKLNPLRIVVPAKDKPYIKAAEIKPKPVKGLSFKHLPNQLSSNANMAHMQASAVSWRGGILTQVRSVPVPVPVVVPVPVPVQRKPVTRKGMTPRERRYAARMARSAQRESKQIVTSCDPRITLIASRYKRNGSVIDPNNQVGAGYAHVRVGSPAW
jgi:hypothetical protein